MFSPKGNQSIEIYTIRFIQLPAVCCEKWDYFYVKQESVP